MNIPIMFKVNDKVTSNVLHEWLCKAIHEQDHDALLELYRCVFDISDMSDPSDMPDLT